MTKRPNILFLVLDALRYDIFEHPEDARILVPNLAALAEQGFLRRVVSNGMITKVAMGPLMTQTYPLEYGGYNDVIASRPASFVELLRAAGYNTYLQFAANITGPTGRVERGGDRVAAVWDHHLALDNYFNHVLNHELALWKRGERSDAEMFARLTGEMDALLAYMASSTARPGNWYLPGRLRRLSRREAARYTAERDLIRRDPLAVARKILSVPAKMYRNFLGEAHVSARRLALLKRVDRARNTVNRVLHFLTRQPAQVFPGYVGAVATEVRRLAEPVLREARGPWFAMLHFMDAHDYKRISRPANLLNKLRFLPRLWRIKRQGKTARDPLYDVSVAHMDDQVGKLLRSLKAWGQADDLLIVAVGDHGFGWDKDRPTSYLAELGFRTHYEHLEVPFLMSPMGRRPADNGLYDSMSISATLLAELGIPAHPSFRGRSVFEGGRAFSLLETVGRGNTDLQRRDVFFTLTTETHKMMAVLKQGRLDVARFYDKRADPRELNNLVADPAQAPHIARLIDHLWEDRADLLRARGLSPRGHERTAGAA